MFNPDILSKADRVMRPVLKELGRFTWIRLEGCCAGHKADDSLWIEVNILGSTGLKRLSDFLKVLDSKLAGTDCRVDCLLSYHAGTDTEPVPHGWIPAVGYRFGVRARVVAEKAIHPAVGAGKFGVQDF